MDAIINNYLLKLSSDTSISDTEYRFLCSIYKISKESNWNYMIFLKSEDMKELTNKTRQSYNKMIANLEMFGFISYESYPGRNGGYFIKLLYLKELLKEVNKPDGIKRISTKIKNNNDSYILDVKNEGLEYHKKYKDNEENISELSSKELRISKDIVKKLNTKEVETVKKFDNLAFLTVEPIKPIPRNCKKSLQFTPQNCKITLQFNSVISSSKIKDLEKISMKEASEIRRILSRAGYIYNINYIIIYNLLNHLLFNGELVQALKNLNEASLIHKESSNKGEDSFDIENDHNLIPQKLRNSVENVYGSDIRFEDAYYEWMEKKDNEGKKITKKMATLDFQMLLDLENPIQSIIESTRRGYKNIHEYKKFGFSNNKKRSSNSDGESSKKINIKKFD